MTRNIRFSVRGGENTVVKGTLSLNGSLDNLSLERLATRIGTSNGSDVRIVFAPDSERVNLTLDGDVYDGKGAGIFVIAVVLVYGLSIVFMISSHLCMKKKMNSDADKMIDAYLNSAPRLRDEGRRESFAKLKRSLMPAIARSPSGRVLIEKRVKYTPYLLSYLPATAMPCGHLGANCGDVLRPDVDRDAALMDQSKISQLPDAHSTDPDWSTTDISVCTSGGQTTGTLTHQGLERSGNSTLSDNKHLQNSMDVSSNDTVSVERPRDINTSETPNNQLRITDTRASDSGEVSDANLSGDDSSVYCSAQSLQHV